MTKPKGFDLEKMGILFDEFQEDPEYLLEWKIWSKNNSITERKFTKVEK